jgi:hypothetical protein
MGIPSTMHKHVIIIMMYYNIVHTQWSFGVTCWEIFNGGKTPYPGVDPLLLSQMLDTEQRLNKPLNAACPDEV